MLHFQGKFMHVTTFNPTLQPSMTNENKLLYYSVGIILAITNAFSDKKSFLWFMECLFNCCF